MKISIYTFVQNGLFLDFHVVEMLKHHLDFADEIIVDEGFSSDGTYEAIKDLDPKIKIERNTWDKSDPKRWSIKYKNRARQQCTGDWCIMLDADEFIPEWNFAELKETLLHAEQPILKLEYINFYGNYKVFNSAPQKFGWPSWKYAIHKNVPDIEAWGDGANVRHTKQHNISDSSIYGESYITVHHFGMVRHAARLRQKWRNQSLRDRHGSNKKPAWDWIPSFIYDMFPHAWDDPDFVEDLKIYEGPFVKAVEENPSEFVRDDFKLYNLLQSRQPN